MKQISFYKSGGNEDQLRKTQKPFVDFFRQSGPVLDIGCGRGIFLELLPAAGLEAFGVDRSEEAISACQKKGLKVLSGDARTFLGRNPGQFGGIFCSFLIEHLAYGGARALLELCHQTLRPNGKTLLLRQSPGSLKLIGRRNLPHYFLRRLILGRHYGRPDTLVLAQKNGNCQLK